MRRGIWIVTGLIAALVVALAMIAAAVPMSADAMRHRIVLTLSERLNSDVRLGDLHLRLFPRLRAEGSELVVRQRGRADVPPLISVKGFTVDADLFGLLRKRVARVNLHGLEINIPPDDHRRTGDGSDQVVATMGDKPRADPRALEDGVTIETLESTGAKLVIIPRRKDKEPKIWDIHALTMHDVGADSAMPFEATLTNAVPPGEITTSGSFGPWNTDWPGNTPLKGDFQFDKADLGVFEGIGGTLSSSGSFGGSLGWIDVKGQTDTPDFVIAVGGHPFPLQTSYHAIVDGTNGDTRLETVDATFLHSHLLAKGAVVDAPRGQKGRIVELGIRMDRARIEDVMQMAVPTPRPPMSGALRLTTTFLLPPGETDVAERLQLDGRFSLQGARFTNYDVQGTIDGLSHRGRGRDPEARKDGVFSQFEGRFKLANGRLALPQLVFAVPGARVQLAGGYHLKSESLGFAGTMSMDATISQTQTGVKKLLFKAIDPLFKKKGGGSAIPFRIAGTRDDPKFGLDFRRVFRRGGRS